MYEIKPLSVHQKMYRAREHFEALEKVLDVFYKERLEKVRSIQRVDDLVAFNANTEVPKRIPLILGDCLQNMRSSLDYLIWELVKANNHDPGLSHMFPICNKKGNYKKALEAERLKDIPDEAAATIDALQPFHHAFAERNRHMLVVLDQLTNINKHRHVLGTLVVNRLAPGDLPPRHYMEARIFNSPENGEIATGRILSYIAFEDSSVEGIEIASAIDALFRFLVEQVFSSFEKFFE
jgi:hypothetical protein